MHEEVNKCEWIQDWLRNIWGRRRGSLSILLLLLFLGIYLKNWKLNFRERNVTWLRSLVAWTDNMKRSMFRFLNHLMFT